MIRKCYCRLKQLYIKKQLPNVGIEPQIGKGLSVIGGEYIKIGDFFTSHDYLRIEAIDRYAKQIFTPSIVIGNEVNFGKFCHIGCINSISIGDGVLLGSNVLIIDHQHGSTTKIDEKRPYDRKLESKGEIIIGNNVWIGDNAVIMPGVKVGDNVIIGAHTVVTSDIPDNTVVAGVPARVVRELE